MEPSQFFGGAEECHSSESGWTMYIGSPIDDDDDDGHTSDDGDNEDTKANPEDDESDDSMASDASSGPSHHENPSGNSEGSHGQADAVDEDVYDGIYCLDKKGVKTKEKQIAEEKVEKKEKAFMDNKSKVAAEVGGKVRKNHWIGKRK